ncbi:MAG TPA: response regulator [Caulobacteraceae bacterium]|nr:response regulator [Caulobacteraceae bacterium]
MSDHLRSPEGQPTARAAAEPVRSHVLIVDDHAPSRRLCAGYCDLFDHTSEMVAGGAEALAALRRERFHVVVMNVHMAETGGLETLRAIRALPGPAGETPVIGLTAIGRDDEAQRWLGAGLAGVLTKPITAARLYAALSMVAEGQPAAARSWAPAG